MHHAFPLVIFLSGIARPKTVFQNCCTKLLSPAVCDNSHCLGLQALGPSQAAIKVLAEAVVSSLVLLIPLLSFLILAILMGVEEYHIMALIFMHTSSMKKQLNFSFLIYTVYFFFKILKSTII